MDLKNRMSKKKLDEYSIQLLDLMINLHKLKQIIHEDFILKIIERLMALVLLVQLLLMQVDLKKVGQRQIQDLLFQVALA